MELTLNWDRAESGSGVTYDACIETPDKPNVECSSIATFTDVETGSVFIPTFEQLNEGSIYIQATLGSDTVMSNEIALSSITHEGIYFTQIAENDDQHDEIAHKFGIPSTFIKATMTSKNITVRKKDGSNDVTFPLDNIIPPELSHIDATTLKSAALLADDGRIFGVKDKIFLISWYSKHYSEIDAFQGFSVMKYDDNNKATLLQ